MNNSNFNTNIDDYNIDDLLNLLELNDPSKEEIIEKIEILNNNYFNEPQHNDIRSFFFAAQNKLLNDFTIENNYINNDIFSNTNDDFLIEPMANLNSVSETTNTLNNSIKNSNFVEDNIANDDLDNNPDNNPDLDDSELLGNSNLNEVLFNADEDNKIDNIKINKEIVENYELYNHLHFNTLYRAKDNPILETPVPSTNSDFILSSPITNVSQIKLAALTIKKPLLISEAKFNNKFTIKKYNNANICDFSYILTINNGYYEEAEDLVRYITRTLQSYIDVTNVSGEKFIKALNFSIDNNSKKIKFELNYNDISNTDFNYYNIDFASHYVPYYSLATIMGFVYNKSSTYYNSINDISNIPQNNTTIISPFSFCNIGNRELFFCFDEYQSNIIETHKLFLNNNMSTFKILGKINVANASSKSNYYVNEQFTSNNSRTDTIRKYNGLINLLNFNIKIIDYYGNIVNTDINEDFTFTLEARINRTRLKNE
tara:strand:- start:3150 stop:4607 length:1458 start_codon:yes stop_codon:yes gene_type:complete